jgi:2-amino-4-hydroxy-6-hydroxymethyldihydropteridine diphosphokinase
MTTDCPSSLVAFALGSNLGNRLEFLRKAVAALASCVEIESVSPVYETAPAYVKDQPVFLNAAVIGKTKLEPLALLWSVKNIENELGRTPTFRYGPRIVDIDILFYADRIIDLPELTVPHPRLAERDFVLRPLSDIAAELRHPKTGQTVAGMLALLPPGTMTCVGKLAP